MESRTCHLIANRIFVHVYRKITIYVTPFLSSQGLASNIAGVEQDTQKQNSTTQIMLTSGSKRPVTGAVWG